MVFDNGVAGGSLPWAVVGGLTQVTRKRDELGGLVAELGGKVSSLEQLLSYESVSAFGRARQGRLPLTHL
jgi:hypothetical protein